MGTMEVKMSRASDMHRSVTPCEVLRSVSLSDSHIDRQVAKKVCRIDRSIELNMSLFLTMVTIFCTQAQHRGRMNFLHKSTRPIMIEMAVKAANSWNIFRNSESLSSLFSLLFSSSSFFPT